MGAPSEIAPPPGPVVDPERREQRLLARLYALLALLHVLPFWVVRWVPTTDGPCHTYTSWVLHQLVSGDASALVRRHYAISWLPYPNWSGHALMALLMTVVTPAVAEKLLASLYVLAFLGGAWYLAGSQDTRAVRAAGAPQRWPAFLALFLPFNHLFQYGFYNFCLGLAAFLFTVGFWLRHRERPGLRFAAGLSILLLLCWFSHLLAYCLALACIGVLWLCFLRRTHWRRQLLHPLILLPHLALPAWFLGRREVAPSGGEGSLLARLDYLMPPEVLFSFSSSQHRLARLVAIAVVVLAALTVRRRMAGARRTGRRWAFAPADAFLLLAGLATALYLAAPGALAGGELVSERLSLFPYLLLIPWLAPGLTGWPRRLAVATLALAALLQVGYLVRWYRLLDREVVQYARGLELAPRGARVLPLLFSRHRTAARADVFGHAASRVALERGLVDWGNYEVGREYFPVQRRADVPTPDLAELETEPWRMAVRRNRRLVDAVYTWQMPPGSPLRERLSPFYRLAWTADGGELYLRAGPATAARRDAVGLPGELRR